MCAVLAAWKRTALWRTEDQKLWLSLLTMFVSTKPCVLMLPKVHLQGWLDGNLLFHMSFFFMEFIRNKELPPWLVCACCLCCVLSQHHHFLALLFCFRLCGQLQGSFDITISFQVFPCFLATTQHPWVSSILFPFPVVSRRLSLLLLESGTPELGTGSWVCKQPRGCYWLQAWL